MNISRWGKRATLDKTPGQMVRVSRDEALSLITSLSTQLLRGEPNSGRVESWVQTEKGREYFSISVVSDEEAR